ncbi:MAG: lytic transglycosylase domain-containing protein [Microbacteriaceae bacterium]
MTRRSAAVATPQSQSTARRSALAVRKSATVVFSFIAASAFILVNLSSPYSTDMATAANNDRFGGAVSQGLTTNGEYAVSVGGEAYVSAKKSTISSSAGGSSLGVVVPDPGSAQAIAHDMVIARGWGEGEFSCLVELWAHESGWRVNAGNAVTGAYGIPQALPGSKMASVADDWATNPATQITWGLGYVSGRYGTPCGAWGAFQDKGWY